MCNLGACVNIPTSSEWYAVHAALEDKNEKMLKFFMEKGVDIYGVTTMNVSEEVILFYSAIS